MEVKSGYIQIFNPSMPMGARYSIRCVKCNVDFYHSKHYSEHKCKKENKMNIEERRSQVEAELKMISALTDAERKSILRLMVGYAEDLKSTVASSVDTNRINQYKETIDELKSELSRIKTWYDSDKMRLDLIEKLIEDR